MFLVRYSSYTKFLLIAINFRARTIVLLHRFECAVNDRQKKNEHEPNKSDRRQVEIYISLISFNSIEHFNFVNGMAIVELGRCISWLWLRMYYTFEENLNACMQFYVNGRWKIFSIQTSTRKWKRQYSYRSLEKYAY